MYTIGIPHRSPLYPSPRSSHPSHGNLGRPHILGGPNGAPRLTIADVRTDLGVIWGGKWLEFRISMGFFWDLIQLNGIVIDVFLHETLPSSSS